MAAPDSTTEAAILARLIEPEKPALSADAARSILALAFAEPDRQAMQALAEKARAGMLSEEEQTAVNNYERVGALLAIMQSKARVSLKHSSTAS